MKLLEISSGRSLIYDNLCLPENFKVDTIIDYKALWKLSKRDISNYDIIMISTSNQSFYEQYLSWIDFAKEYCTGLFLNSSVNMNRKYQSDIWIATGIRTAKTVEGVLTEFPQLETLSFGPLCIMRDQLGQGNTSNPQLVTSQQEINRWDYRQHPRYVLQEFINVCQDGIYTVYKLAFVRDQVFPLWKLQSNHWNVNAYSNYPVVKSNFEINESYRSQILKIIKTTGADIGVLDFSLLYDEVIPWELSRAVDFEFTDTNTPTWNIPTLQTQSQFWSAVSTLLSGVETIITSNQISIWHESIAIKHANNLIKRV